MYLKKILKIILKTLAIIVLLVVLYFISAFVFMYIPVNSDFKPCEQEAVEVYILTNGVHTDIVLPVKNEAKDWTGFVNPANTKSKDSTVNYVGFGWGDKGFYLETPTWAELKFSTAFNAMFFLGSTAMHVTFHKSLKENKSCKKICISKESYNKLITYIENSFDRMEGSARLIENASYGNNDVFYEAIGTYSLFTTCNTWANAGLKAAELKACLWTPFDKGIFHHYSE